jgi:hypothetical protein
LLKTRGPIFKNLQIKKEDLGKVSFIGGSGMYIFMYFCVSLFWFYCEKYLKVKIFYSMENLRLHVGSTEFPQNLLKPGNPESSDL